MRPRPETPSRQTTCGAAVTSTNDDIDGQNGPSQQWGAKGVSLSILIARKILSKEIDLIDFDACFAGVGLPPKPTSRGYCSAEYDKPPVKTALNSFGAADACSLEQDFAQLTDHGSGAPRWRREMQFDVG